MQRESFWRLYARLISFHRAAYERVSKHGGTTELSASPTLVFTAVTLVLILTILEIDLHRDELRELGFIFSDKGAEFSKSVSQLFALAEKLTQSATPTSVPNFE